MTLAQLKGLVNTATAEWRTSNVSLQHIFPENVALWVQQAIYRLDADLSWTQGRITTKSVAATRRYTLTSLILRIQHVTYAGAELDALTTAEEIARQEVDTDDATPTNYSWYGTELALYPTPDTTDDDIEVWAVQTPAALTTDTSIPTLPLHTHGLLATYALHQAFMHLGRLEQSEACMRMYLEAMERERQNYLNTRGVQALRRDERVVF